MEKREVEQYRTLSFWDAYEDEQFYWISNVAFNGLFKIDKEDYSSQFILHFNEVGMGKGLHKQIISYNHYLIFIPELAHNIVVYNKVSGETKYISLEMPDSNKQELNVAQAYIYKDQIWLFPSFASQRIIVLNPFSWSISSYTYLKEYAKLCNLELSGRTFATPVFIDEYAWIPIKNKNVIICFNMETKEIDRYILQDDKIEINNISYNEDIFYVTLSNQADIVIWSPKKGILERITIYDKWQGKSPAFSFAICIKEKQYLLLPARSEYILLMKEGKIKQLPYPKEFYWVNDFKVEWTRIPAYKIKDNKIDLYPSVGNMFLTYEIETEQLSGSICEIPREWTLKDIASKLFLPKYSRKMKCWGHVKEEKDFSIVDLLANLDQLKVDVNINQDCCGKNIYEYIKKSLT